MKYVLFFLLVLKSINAGICSSKVADAPVGPMQLNMDRRASDARLLRMRRIQATVKRLSLADLAYFKKEKSIDYQLYGLLTEEDLKFFMFLIDVRYQQNRHAFEDQKPIIKQVRFEPEESISQPGLDAR
jgi:hypothetical protein